MTRNRLMKGGGIVKPTRDALVTGGPTALVLAALMEAGVPVALATIGAVAAGFAASLAYRVVRNHWPWQTADGVANAREAVSSTSRKTSREHEVAKGGSTRASNPRSGRSGSDPNSSKGTRGN